MAKYTLASYDDYIYVKYTHQNQRFTISTSILSDKLFDPVTKSLNKRHPEYLQAKRRTDTILNNMITASHRVMTAGFEPTVHLVRSEYNKVLDGSTPVQAESVYPNFYERWHEYMKIKAVEMRPDGFRNYTQLYELLREFEEMDGYEMDFGTFDAVMFGRFKQFMFTVKKYMDATTQKHVKKLRAFYNYAVPDLDKRFMTFSPNTILNIHPLTPGEFHMLIDADLGQGYLDKARDLFVFCACTGMRYGDSQRFEKEWVNNNGIIKYTQRKTSMDAMVPMLETANRILLKYGYNTPKMTMQPYNRHLKEVFKELGINRLVKVHESRAGKVEQRLMYFWQYAGSHTARKTFITYALHRGVPIQDVMKMSGHHDYRTMKAYIFISDEHIKAQAEKFDI